MSAKQILNIAILITCHNRKAKTLLCLNSLFAQDEANSRYKFDVYLVDDGSIDGTGEEVAKKFPTVNIIPGSGNLYWNRGMHLAWQSAVNVGGYDFYLWLNDDTLLFKEAISELLNCYDLAGEKSIICGITCSQETGKITYGGTTWSGELIDSNGELQKCDIMNGNCVLISKSAFNAIGFNDPIFIHSIGDYDYGLRAVKKGYSIFTTRSFIAYCERHENLPKWCLPHVKYNERFKSLYSPLGNSHPYFFFIYEKRHFGLLTAVKHFFSIHLRALIPSLWK